MNRRNFIFGVFFLVGPIKSASADIPKIAVYKTPTCGCCSAWIKHIKKAGFHVKSENVTYGELAGLKRRYGIPPELSSCHTAFINSYFVEGHVPAEDIKALIFEKPEALGLSVPNMPIGSPGMEMRNQKDPYDTLLVKSNGSSKVFRATVKLSTSTLKNKRE
jgi:hypothetical protein